MPSACSREKRYGPPSAGARSGAPSGDRATPAGGVGRSPSGPVAGGAPASTDGPGRSLTPGAGPTSSAAPYPTASTSTTASRARRRRRPRRCRRGGSGGPARQGTGDTGKPAASSRTHCGTRPVGDDGRAGSPPPAALVSSGCTPRLSAVEATGWSQDGSVLVGSPPGAQLVLGLGGLERTAFEPQILEEPPGPPHLGTRT